MDSSQLRSSALDKALAAELNAQAALQNAMLALQNAEADAEKSRKFRNTLLTNGALAVGGTCVVGLAVDFWRHESRAAIKWRIRSKLLAMRPPRCAVPPPLVRLTPLQQPLVPKAGLTLLTGPLGSGKSTMLADLARALAKQGTPTALVKIRLANGRGRNAITKDSAYEALLNQTAATILAQIGAPPRRAFFRLMFPSRNVFHLTAALDAYSYPYADLESVIRGLQLWFETAADICLEREARGIPRREAAPVLLFDDLHDLLKDPGFARRGGGEIVNVLAALLVKYGTKKGLVRAVTTCSSGQLRLELKKTALLGARYRVHLLLDPPEQQVHKALTERGYAASEASQLIELCGTRLRLLRGPLARSIRPCAADVNDSLMDSAHLQFLSLFAELTPSDAAVVAVLFDQIEAAERGCGSPPSYHALPDAAEAADISRFLFINADGGLQFQSSVHRLVWREKRPGAELLPGKVASRC